MNGVDLKCHFCRHTATIYYLVLVANTRNQDKFGNLATQIFRFPRLQTPPNVKQKNINSALSPR